MYRIYLDHNVVDYCFARTKTIITPEAQSLINDASNTIVLSSWNLIEAAKSNDGLYVIESLMERNPLFLAPYSYISEHEIKHFIYHKIFNDKNSTLPNVFCSTLAQVHSCYPLMAEYGIPIDITTTEFVKYMRQYSDALNKIVFAAHLYATQIKTLVKLEIEGTYIINEKDEFCNYILTKIPRRDHNGQVILQPERKLLVEECWKNKKIFYQLCRSIQIEQLLFDYRRRSKQNFSDNDILDMQHQSCALPNCDYFISNDGFVISGNEYVKKRTKVAKTIKAEIVK